MTWVDALPRGATALFFIVCGGAFINWGFQAHATAAGSSFLLACAALLVLLGAWLVVYAVVAHVGAGTNLQLLERGYGEAKTFFAAPFFYVVLGCAFLYISFQVLNVAHSAFVFLLAILGVAILLYGTGTQAAMTGRGGADRLGATGHIAIAGGAGALAAFFGFGVVYMATDIQKVFKHTLDYGVLEIVASQALDGYDIQARHGDGRPLHQLRNENKAQILVPFYGTDSSSSVTVSVNALEKNSTRLINLRYTITWTDAAGVKVGATLNNVPVDKPFVEPVRVTISPGVNSEKTFWVEHVLNLPQAARLAVAPTPERLADAPAARDNVPLHDLTVNVVPQ